MTNTADIKARVHSLRRQALYLNRLAAELMEQVRGGQDNFLDREPVDDPFVGCISLTGEQQATD